MPARSTRRGGPARPAAPRRRRSRPPRLPRPPGRGPGSISTVPDRGAVDQPVADTPYVDDETIAFGSELLPQAAGMRVQRPGRAHGPESPHVSQQLLLGEHAGRLGRQGPQEGELLLRYVPPAPPPPTL